MLAPCRVNSDGEILDLTDPAVHHIEQRHAALLAAHGMAHLDITQITLRRRTVTRTLATDVYDELGCAGIRFPSRLDGLPCFALFEGRARLEAIDPPIPLTDPLPQHLRTSRPDGASRCNQPQRSRGPRRKPVSHG